MVPKTPRRPKSSFKFLPSVFVWIFNILYEDEARAPQDVSRRPPPRHPKILICSWSFNIFYQDEPRAPLRIFIGQFQLYQKITDLFFWNFKIYVSRRAKSPPRVPKTPPGSLRDVPTTAAIYSGRRLVLSRVSPVRFPVHMLSSPYTWNTLPRCLSR